jgi:hypothetical protein
MGIAGAALALGLAAQGVVAQNRRDRDPIDVSVVNGRIVVEEEVVTNDREGGLVWRIVTPGYRFAPDKGIDFNIKREHECRSTASPVRFRCGKLGHRRGARFKYAINLIDPAGQPMAPLDPFIVNN